jgi:hypothetical protein
VGLPESGVHCVFGSLGHVTLFVDLNLEQIPNRQIVVT